MKKIILVLFLTLFSSPTLASGWHLCEQETVKQQLWNFYVNTVGVPEYTQYLATSDNYQFVKGTFREVRHLGPGDYSITLCMAEINVRAIDGRTFTWNQPYKVRYMDVWEIDLDDGVRFAMAVMGDL